MNNPRTDTHKIIKLTAFQNVCFDQIQNTNFQFQIFRSNANLHFITLNPKVYKVFNNSMGCHINAELVEKFIHILLAYLRHSKHQLNTITNTL